MNTSVQETYPQFSDHGPSRRRLFVGVGVVVVVGLVVLAALVLAGIVATLSWFTLSSSEADGPPAPVVMGMGPGISVQDALASTLEGPLLVNGFVYVTAEGVVYFTDALAESYPPSIDLARSLRVEGLDVAGLTGLEQAQGISWSETSTQLAGYVDGGVLNVAAGVQP